MPPKKSNKKARDKKEARKMADGCHDQMTKITTKSSTAALSTEAAALLECLFPPRLIPESTTIIRKLAILAGTDLEKNDSDPYGDGDQSGVGEMGTGGEPSRQILRDMFSQGGDLSSYLQYQGFSTFGMYCASGNMSAVEQAIRATKQGSSARMNLLERRESGVRLSPLLLTVALSKFKPSICSMTKARIEDMDHLGVIRVLLRHGARPDARDLTGKTLCHYGAGVMATEETLKMNDYCIDAAKTCKHFGKEIVVRNLTKDEYNGLEGVLGGYLAENGRRQVILNNGKELSLLPKNVFSIVKGIEGRQDDDERCILDNARNLVNEPDRLGSISLHEVFMSQRIDVATYLTDKHDASLDVEDRAGTSVRKMSFTPQIMGVSSMNQVIRKHALKKNKEENNVCRQCQKIVGTRNVCSICKTAVYCSADCQHKDWKKHKKQCKSPEEYSIELARPRKMPGVVQLMNRNGTYAGGDYKRPDAVEVDELFWIKVQSNSESGPHLIYDKTRTCTFQIWPQTHGHRELFEKVSAEKASMGKKTHVKASFDVRGNCKVYPNTATLKNW